MYISLTFRPASEMRNILPQHLQPHPRPFLPLDIGRPGGRGAPEHRELGAAQNRLPSFSLSPVDGVSRRECRECRDYNLTFRSSFTGARRSVFRAAQLTGPTGTGRPRRDIRGNWCARIRAARTMLSHEIARRDRHRRQTGASLL